MLVERPAQRLQQALEGRQLAVVGRGGQGFFHPVVARDDPGADAAHGVSRLEPRRSGRQAIRLRQTGAPALQPGFEFRRLGKQRAQPSILARGGIGQETPCLREVHALALQQKASIYVTRQVFDAVENVDL